MSFRKTYGIMFILVIFLLLISLYLEYFQGILPCPLCTMQRFAFVLIGFFALLGIFIARFFWGRIFCNLFLLLSSSLGFGLAARQIWLQNFPSATNNECGVTLEYMASVLPIKELVSKILQGSAECSVQGWQFLYLNMAEWALVWFMIFIVLSLYLLFKKR